jgi:ABC-type sugar transport system substrate-binding protein
VTGIDATYDACVAIDSGEMTQSIFQNGKAQVTKTWELLQGLAAGKPLPGGDVFIPYDSVVKDNVAKYLEDYKAQGYPK